MPPKQDPTGAYPGVYFRLLPCLPRVPRAVSSRNSPPGEALDRPGGTRCGVPRPYGLQSARGIGNDVQERNEII